MRTVNITQLVSVRARRDCNGHSLNDITLLSAKDVIITGGLPRKEELERGFGEEGRQEEGKRGRAETERVRVGSERERCRSSPKKDAKIENKGKAKTIVLK